MQGNHGRSNSARAHPSHSSLRLSNRRRAIKLPNWGYSHLRRSPGWAWAALSAWVVRAKRNAFAIAVALSEVAPLDHSEPALSPVCL